ncbi:MAG: adenosylcobalamin-dependent ribonucleoside-diphosphate reductase [Candidatus Woesearchaeota archaeon]
MLDEKTKKEIEGKFDLDFFKEVKIKKRDGTTSHFDIERIYHSIYQAMMAKQSYDEEKLEKVMVDVLKTSKVMIEEKDTPSVEGVQDIIEVSLMKNGLFETAKAYILYREEKFKVREKKKEVLNKEVLDSVDKRFSLNSLRVLESRYLKKDNHGNVIESPKGMFDRVAINGALSEIVYDEKIFSKKNVEENYVFKYNEKKDSSLYDDENSELGIKKETLEIVKSYLPYLHNYEDYKNKFMIGKYRLNEHHFERLIYGLIHEILNGRITIKSDDFIDLLESDYFDKHESFIEDMLSGMTNQRFMPNTPSLVNSGRSLGMLSACFTMDMQDSMESIMTAAYDTALVQKTGGGTGINFSKLRPKDDIVGSTKGVSSGPLSFMKIIDSVSDVIKQGGVRRGANMGILDAWHPNINEFIRCKEEEGKYENFNISVGLWEDFWESYYNEEDYSLLNKRTGEKVKEIDPSELIERLSYYAWLKADPGVLFFDNINKRNVLIDAKGGKINTTNPCGEEPLYVYESCNLTSLNIINYVKEGEFDWDAFSKDIKTVAHYLDNAISINKYPIKKIEYNTKLTRRIGIGIMGLANALFDLEIKYNSKEGFNFMKKVMEYVTYYGYETSAELSEKRGAFPIYGDSDFTKGDLPVEGFYNTDDWTLNWTDLVKKIKEKGVRNAMVTTMPPTGSTGMISDTTSGIEPTFALAYEKRVTVGDFVYANDILEKKLKERGIYSKKLLKKIAKNGGSLKGIDEIPEDLREIFVTSMDMHWLDHVVAQSQMQKWVTDSISKTINMPSDVEAEDVMYSYLISHELGCKGITVYRDGSKSNQVLNAEKEEEKGSELKPSDYSVKLLKKKMESFPKLGKIIEMEKILKRNDGNLELFLKEKDHDACGDDCDCEEEDCNCENEEVIQTKSRNSVHNKDDTECPVCGEKVVMESGCKTCHSCGWSACSSA